MTQEQTGIDLNGTVTSPKGFKAGGSACNIKESGSLDLGILTSDNICTAAGVFTTSQIRAAAIEIDEELLENGQAQTIIVNSGNANASTGKRGIGDARKLSELAAKKCGTTQHNSLVSSTGIIGHHLPMELIEEGIQHLELTTQGGHDFARAIMTTDIVPKTGSVKFGDYTIGGCAKGSGMIHPNMATMLAYLTTDAPIEQKMLQTTLVDAVEKTFNLISVDGDTSPSDTVIILANGTDQTKVIKEDSELAKEFAEALTTLCEHLAKAIVRDGEGATKLIEIEIENAKTIPEAKTLIRDLTTSYLLKTAIHGSDPNWGRIVSVIGRSNIEIVGDAVTVAICDTLVFENGEPSPYDEKSVAKAMESDTISIKISVGSGNAYAKGWGCDLSAEYVRINADYTT